MSDARTAASEIKTILSTQQRMVKTAQSERDEAVRKVASLETENRVLAGVLDMVSKGLIDPSEAPEKVAQFLQDPEQFEVVKTALELGLQSVPSIGVPASDSSERKGPDPISDFLASIEHRLRS